MKIIEEKKAKTLILEENDIVNVKTLKGNPITIEIKCINGCLLIEDVPSKRIKEVSMEQTELEALKQYNQKKISKKAK